MEMSEGLNVVASFTWQDICIILIVALLTRWVFYTFLQPFFSPLRKIPGKPFRPFVGNMFEALNAEAMSNAIRWTKEVGSLTLRYYSFGGREQLLTADPKVFRHVMVTNEKNYHRVNGNVPIINFVKKALFFLSGSLHHSVRKLLNPAFGIKILENMLPVFEGKGGEVVSIWRKECEQSSDTPVQIPVQEFMTRITLDSIFETGLNYKLNAVSDPEQAGVKMLNKYLQQAGGRSLMASLIPFYNSLPTKSNRLRWSEEEHLTNVINEHIAAKRKQYADGDPKHAENVRDFLSLLVLARDEEGRPIPDDLVFENVTGLMFAGFDTTSTTLTWTMLHLATYPEVQSRVRAEIKDVFPDGCTGFTHENLDKLKYLTCVIKETQRLYPVVSNTTRVALEDDVIEGMEIPAGTRIVLHLGALHRSEENWKDAETFKPERFLEEVEPYKHLPFITGPYMCIGHKFAMFEMKIILASLIREFEVSLTPGFKFRRIQALSIKPNPPLVLNVKRIQ